MDTAEMKKTVRRLRADVLRMFYRSRTGHLSSALSCLEILSVLYLWDARSRDRIVLSKGHGAAALYAVLAEKGLITRDELATFYGDASRLLALASPTLPGIDVPTGSLGQGVTFATGLAKAFAIDEIPAEEAGVFAILGDGEMQEGSVWEAAMFASASGLKNLVFLLDANGIQGGGRVADILPTAPIAAKWEAFGWAVEEVDGHDVYALHQIVSAFRKNAYGKPLFIIAHTKKGHGISFIEDDPNCHMRVPRTDAEWEQACRDFGMTMQEVEEF